MPHKKLFLSLLTLFFLQITVAQKVNAIDQKGTKVEIINNIVTTADIAPKNPNSNDIWFNSTITPATVNIFDGKKWVSLEHKGKPGSVFFASSDSIPTDNSSQLFWDNTAKSLRVGATGDTGTKLTVNGKVVSNTALELKGTLIDALSLPGIAGQVLTSTSSGTKWQTNTNWLINGNSGTTASNFLGTTDNVKMTIRSDNLPMLEFGRRKTLKLTANYPDYRDDSQPVVYVRGDTIRSALQFAAAGASFYKPMFYTVDNGSFRLKGSAGGTDMFEIGSAGSNNKGRLEFIVGDDGKEPMIFSRYEFRPTSQGLKEFFRVQGSKDAEDAKTRFGINLNPTSVPLDPTYNTDDNGAIANSTFQVNGSISNSIIDTAKSTAFTLTEDHYAIVLRDDVREITLPTAADIKGRIYVIKNPTSSSVSLSSSSSYLTNLNVTSKVIASGTTLWIQSDGTNWQQITGGSETITTITRAATSGNSIGIYKNEAGSDISINETVTTITNKNTATAKKAIAEYKNETNSPAVSINETVTSLSQSTGTGVITYLDEKGSPNKANVVSADPSNLITAGTDGGAYLSSGFAVSTGSFIIEGPFTTVYRDGKSRTIPIPNSKFNPSQITFTTNSTVDNQNVSAVTDINAISFGNSTGYYSNDDGTLSQQFSFSGGSNRFYNNGYSSYIAPSSYASSSFCLGVVYYDTAGNEYGKIIARVIPGGSGNVSLEVFYIEGNSRGQIYNKKLLVLYTAYR